MSRLKDLAIERAQNEEPGPEDTLQIIDFNKPPQPIKQWQSGLFWVGFYSDGKNEFSKAIVSWPWRCESCAIPLPENVTSQRQALEYLRDQLIEGLKEENGVNGP